MQHQVRLQPLLPSGVTLGKIDLWKDGAALEGRAPDDRSVREWAQALRSEEHTSELQSLE